MASNSSNTKNFFNEQKLKSKIKTNIVTDFYSVYLPIINYSVGKNSSELIYLDLFSGPGVFDDGTFSTPLVLMDMLSNMKNKELSNKIRLVFNDENSKFYNTLCQSILEHKNYDKMSIKPEVFNVSAKDFDLSPYLNMKVPVFSFIDPWGYKDVSASLIWKIVKPIGSDCILFFNSNRILQDLTKPEHINDMIDLFGQEYSRAVEIQKDTLKSQNIKADELLKLFSKNLYCKIKSEPKKYSLFVLPFIFKQDGSTKTSHQIVLLTKNHKAVREMKRIMLKHSNGINKEFSFDSKTVDMFSFFKRDDDVKVSFEDLLTEMFSMAPKLLNTAFTHETLLEYIDRYYIKKNYVVTSYTVGDVKEQIAILYKCGYIDILNANNKSRLKVTLSCEYKFNKQIMG